MRRIAGIRRAIAWIALTLIPLAGRAEDTPLPPVQTVLARVRESSRRELQNDRLFQSRYAFLRTKTSRELDSDGKVKKENTRRSRNRPGIVAARYVPPGKSPATAPRSQPAQKPPNTQSDAFDKSEFALNDDLLNRFEFTIAGREQLHGRPSLQIQFKPANKKLPSRELKDRFINK